MQASVITIRKETIMEHGPATEWQEDASQDYKTKLGLIMCAVFVVVYLAFILTAVISPRTMAVDVGKLNLAIVFGFGIIVLAIVEALVYNYLCSRREKLDQKAGEGEAE